MQCLSVIVKTGADLRQEQMAVQLIQVTVYATRFSVLLTHVPLH
jgi:hypothetical protein